MSKKEVKRIKCSSCDGSGWEVKGDIVCKVCKGTGDKTNKKKNKIKRKD